MERIDERAETLMEVARHADAYMEAARRLKMNDEICAGARELIRSKKHYPKLYQALTLAIVFGERSAAPLPVTYQAFGVHVYPTGGLVSKGFTKEIGDLSNIPGVEYVMASKREVEAFVKKIDDDFINGWTP
jgi:hypothetical protein